MSGHRYKFWLHRQVDQAVTVVLAITMLPVTIVLARPWFPVMGSVIVGALAIRGIRYVIKRRQYW